MDLFNWITKKDISQNEKLIRKFLNMNLPWEKNTDSAIGSGYKAVFYTREMVDHAPDKSLIRIFEYYGNEPEYRIHIEIGTPNNRVFKFVSKSYLAKALLEQARSRIRAKEEEEEQEREDKSEKLSSYILGLLP